MLACLQLIATTAVGNERDNSESESLIACLATILLSSDVEACKLMANLAATASTGRLIKRMLLHSNNQKTNECLLDNNPADIRFR